MSYVAINAWSESDRPREKLKTRGREALTDAELIAILLGSGTRGQSAVSLAQCLLRAVNDNLHELGKCAIKDLAKHRGMGEAKAITVLAALELGRRRHTSNLRARPRVTNSRDAFDAIAPLMSDLSHEEFWILLLNRANEIFTRERISTGGLSGTVVDIKMVLKIAIDQQAAAFIAVHNHPSGNLNPSQADVELTRRLRDSGRLLDMPLLDHLIVSERGYYSFADEGAL